MTRIRFEDLPSRNTPRNAENLNKLNNVVISPTEPTTGEEVWIKKGKNLFDGSFLGNYGIDTSTGALTSLSNRIVTDYIEIQENTNYVISSSNDSLYEYVCYYDENKNFISATSWLDRLNATFETPNDAKFILVCFKLEEAGSATINSTDVTNLQLEQGSTATEYEEYIDKEIYVKNDNGVYELFDKVEEPQYCQVTRSSSITLNIPNTQYEKTKMPFNKIDKQQGDFSLADGGVKIGKNINRIKLTANIMVNNITQEGMFTLIVRTNNEQSKAFSYFRLKAFEPKTFTYIIDVKENDVVDVAFQNQETSANKITIYGTSDYATTSMLIEKIA